MGNEPNIDIDETVSVTELERAATAEEVSVYRWRLETVYRAHNAQKLSNIPNLLRKHRHRLRLLHALYLRICEKYKVTAEEMFVAPQTKAEASDVQLDVGAIRLHTHPQREETKEEKAEHVRKAAEIEEKVVCATAYASLFGSPSVMD